VTIFWLVFYFVVIKNFTSRQTGDYLGVLVHTDSQTDQRQTDRQTNSSGKTATHKDIDLFESAEVVPRHLGTISLTLILTAAAGQADVEQILGTLYTAQFKQRQQIAVHLIAGLILHSTVSIDSCITETAVHLMARLILHSTVSIDSCICSPSHSSPSHSTLHSQHRVMYHRYCSPSHGPSHSTLHSQHRFMYHRDCSPFHSQSHSTLHSQHRYIHYIPMLLNHCEEKILCCARELRAHASLLNEPVLD